VPDNLVLLMEQAWEDLDTAIAGLTSEQAIERRDGQSAIAWSVAHVTQQVDSWLNMRLQGLPPHPVISDPRYHTGASGDVDDWPGLLAAVAEVRARARRWLATNPPLEPRVPYTGGIAFVREHGLSLRYALMSIAAHTWQHAGEIATLRSLRGNPVDETRGDWGRSFI
jgi:hypothetical protein